MPFEADFETVAGTALYVAAAMPADNTAVAFAALTWIEVGEITNVPSVLGREYSESTISTVKNAHDRKKKGSYSLPNADWECAWVEDDAGQVLVREAANNNDILPFKVVKQGASIRYLSAQVSKFVENNGTSNDAVKGSFTMLRQSDTIIA
jgi:hypothetical protein